MLAFLGAPENIAFVSAILLMLLIGVVQAAGLGQFGTDADLDIDMDADFDGGPDFDLLGWLGFGRLPLSMLLVVWLAAFGMAGLIGQQASHDWLGMLQPGWIAIPAAALAAFPLTGLAARGLARVLPRDHTTAVELETLTGRMARIVTGRAREGSPARARVEDRHGQNHYVMVEPANPGQVFEEGETVLLVRREDNLFRAISRGDHHLPRLEA